MTLHSIIQYCKYRLKAKTRHGVHSPFVYAFIEKCLMPRNDDSLLQRIRNYFTGYSIIEQNAQQYDQCIDALKKANRQAVIVLHYIHQAEAATESWNKLSHLTRVRLSIDLFDIGLLFFNDDIKEQQHFVLKYPL